MRGGPRGFHPGFPCPDVLRWQIREVQHVSPTGLLPCVAGLSRPLRLHAAFVTSRHRSRQWPIRSYDPELRYTREAITRSRFRLVPFRSPLLGESRFLSVPPVTEMCHFTGLPSTALCVQAEITAHYGSWVSPFGDPRVTGRSAPHRGLSQPSKSFLGSWRQGIHRVPFVS